MNTVIRVKNGCSMSWRETIEGKIYLYGKELAARPMRTAVARCARSLQSIVPLFRRTWARISFAWSLIGRLFVEKPRPDIGHLHKRDFARRHCPCEGSLLAAKNLGFEHFSDRPNEVRVCQLLQLLCDSSLIDRLRGVRAPFRFLHLRS
jgi:hypothetical protein